MKPIIILGGGLWGSLLAHRLKTKRPEVSFELYEATDRLGGNHTWSFHESDVDPAHMNWLMPFIRKSWNGYEVKFPAYNKFIDLKYHTITSDKFHALSMNDSVRLSSPLDFDEAKNKGSFVIDARGGAVHENCCWQKFVGHEVFVEEGHGFKHPVLMDATVSQIDGFRFTYVLPFDEKTLLVEDTYYSDNPDIRLTSHPLGKLIRTEAGVLPIPFGKIDSQDLSLSGIFHDTTGYSLPDAIRLVEELTNGAINEQIWRNKINSYRQKRENDRMFFRLLNKLMFKASDPQNRYKMLEHFYKLPNPVIGRFYAGKMTTIDRARIFIGKPPVPISKAIRSLIYD